MTTPSQPDDLLARAQSAREEAALAMARLGGSTSACAMAKDGRSFPAYKYHEGRAAALGTLVRRLTRSDGRGARELARSLVEEWARDAERWNGHGRDWEAYTAGGLDAARTVEEWVG